MLFKANIVDVLKQTSHPARPTAGRLMSVDKSGPKL
jgi:hypothetical protein